MVKRPINHREECTAAAVELANAARTDHKYCLEEWTQLLESPLRQANGKNLMEVAFHHQLTTLISCV